MITWSVSFVWQTVLMIWFSTGQYEFPNLNEGIDHDSADIFLCKSLQYTACWGEFCKCKSFLRWTWTLLAAACYTKKAELSKRKLLNILKYHFCLRNPLWIPLFPSNYFFLYEQHRNIKATTNNIALNRLINENERTD